MKTVFALLALAIAGSAIAAPATPAAAPAPAPAAANSAPTGPASAMPTPNKGKVVDVIPASMYTYIQVSTDKGNVWIAASSIKVAKGDTISYSNGAVQENFFSPSLKRTFEKLIMVDKVVVAAK